MCSEDMKGDQVSRAEVTVTVVVLSFNRRDELRSTLQKLREVQNTIVEFLIEVIIVDNGSNDGSPQMVSSLFPEFKLVALPENVGIAGRNYGIRLAKGKYILLLDDDAHIEAKDLIKAVHRMEANPKIGILSLNVLSKDGKSFFHSNSLFREGLAFCAAAVLIKKEVFEKAGYFSKVGFLYHDETDLAIRALARGYQINFAPDIVAVHRVSVLNRSSSRSAYYGARSTVLFLSKYFSIKNLIMALPAVALSVLYHLLFRPGRIAYARGLLSGIKLIPKARREEGRRIPEAIQRLYLSRSPYLNFRLALLQAARRIYEKVFEKQLEES